MIKNLQGCLWVAFFLLSLSLTAQVKDTIRDNVNYRMAGAANESNKSTGMYHYLGLQANQLLRQLIGGSGGGDNPYTAVYSFNSTSTGHGMSFGLGFTSRTIEDEDPNTSLNRTTKTGNLSFRIGYDWKKAIGKNWIGGVAVDVFRIGSKSETKANFSGGPETVTNSKSNGYGLGPRLTLLYRVSDKIFLGTEAALYGQSTKTTSEVEFPNTPIQKTTQKDKSITLGVPVALFLMARF